MSGTTYSLPGGGSLQLEWQDGGYQQAVSDIVATLHEEASRELIGPAASALSSAAIFIERKFGAQ